jgi:hypothetical protein
VSPLPETGPVGVLQAGTPTTTPTPTPFDSTAVSSPELAAVAAVTFAVVGALVVVLRLRGR